jgi:prevent-host-death family protein
MARSGRITTLSSRDFNQDASKAKRAAEAGPVIITDRGTPSYVLLTFAEYKRITGVRTPIADLLASPGAAEAELELPRPRDLAEPADLE